MDGLQYTIDFKGNAEQVISHVNALLGSTDGAAKKATKSIGESWKSLLAFGELTRQVDAVRNSMNELNIPGIELNRNMHDLQAITGVAGAGLKEIETAARESAKEFGGSASQNVESYKVLLSKLSPEIGKNSVALKAMGDDVNILSKLMGGNTVAATDVLTTAMNQYGVSLDDPIEASRIMTEMMNVMAKGAQEGSAELPQVGQALEQAGMQAKNANVSFAETNAAIQVLDKAGKKGAEGGVALRNVLAVMGEGRFMPKQTKEAIEAAGISVEALGDKTKPLNQRLQLLKPLLNDSALLTKLFGKENSAAGVAIIQGADQIKEYTKALTGTNSAVEQANVVMDSYEERQKRQEATLQDIKIAYFNATESAQPYINATLTATSEIGKAAAGINAMSTLLVNDYTKALLTSTKNLIWKTTATTAGTTATEGYTVVQRVFNTVMAANPLGIFLRGLLLVGTALTAGAILLEKYNTHQDRAKELTGDLAATIAVEKSELNNLFEQLKRTKPESEKRNELIAQLKKDYPDIIKNQKLEIANENQLELARRDANRELEYTITLEATREAKTKALKQKFDAKKDLFKTLFDKGMTEEEATDYIDNIDKNANDVVAHGNYRGGAFYGADNSLALGIVNNSTTSGFEKMRKNQDWVRKGDIDQAAKAYADKALESGNDINVLDKMQVRTKNYDGAQLQYEQKQFNDAQEEYDSKHGGKKRGKPLEAAVSEGVVDGITKGNKMKGSTAKNANSSGTGGGSGRSLTINKLVETLVIHTTNMNESKERIKESVSEALLTAANDFTLIEN